MAKTMARIENGVVVNIEWLPDRIEETDELKNVNDCIIEVGDTYSEGRFYRVGEVVLSELDKMLNEISAFSSALSEIETLIKTPEVSGTLDTIVDVRKEAILAKMYDMFTALETLEVT